MEVARRALIPLNENEQELCAPTRGRGQAHSPVLISCSGFCHRSPRAENIQSCQDIAEGAGSEGREERRWLKGWWTGRRHRLGSIADGELFDPLEVTPLSSSAPVGCSEEIPQALPERPPAPDSATERTQSWT